MVVRDLKPPAVPPWHRKVDAVLLELKVIPNAKATRPAGLAPDADGRPRLVLRLIVLPVDGKANAAVIAFLAKQLGCPRAARAITSGSTWRHKRVTWSDPPTDAEARLEALLNA